MDPIILKIDPNSGFKNHNNININNNNNNNNNYNNGDGNNLMDEVNDNEYIYCENGNKENNIDDKVECSLYDESDRNEKDFIYHNMICGSMKDIFTIIKNILFEPGGLVSIPTETVYGLAGNIYLEKSVKRIFEIKNRPLNDPLIVHVYSFDYALKHLYDINYSERILIKYLSEKFTPGPLTIVSRCKKSVPTILTNGTGYLAVRCPKNRLCLELLKFIKVPLAAPSANKFGHISPTRPSHVFSEFRGESLYILDDGPSQIGIESTVVKVYCNNDKDKDEYRDYDNGNGNDNIDDCDNNKDNVFCSVEILRKGAVTYEDLRKALEIFKNVKVYESVKVANPMSKMYSPGMLTTHYSPNVPTYMVLVDDNYKEDVLDNYQNGSSLNGNLNNHSSQNIDCRNVVLIDIGCRFKSYSELFKYYLPIQNDPIILANQLYSLLRKAEHLSISKNGCGNNLMDEGNEHNLDKENNKDNEKYQDCKSVIGIYFNEENVNLFSSIHDRLLRATSGNVVYAKEVQGQIKFVRG